MIYKLNTSDAAVCSERLPLREYCGGWARFIARIYPADIISLHESLFNIHQQTLYSHPDGLRAYIYSLFLTGWISIGFLMYCLTVLYCIPISPPPAPQNLK